MLKRCLAVAVMAFPAAAIAEMPIVNTDLLAKDETLVSIAASISESEFTDTATFGSFSFSGVTDTETRLISFALGRGITDRLSVSLRGDYQEYESNRTSVTGSLTQVTTVKLSGVNDPVIAMDYKLLSANYPLVIGIMVSPPTSSDSPGRAGYSLNGVHMMDAQDGDTGTGKTRVVTRLDGSMIAGSNVLEWGIAAAMDDEEDSENIYELRLGCLHRFSGQTSARLSGFLYQQNGSAQNNVSISDTLNAGLGIGLVHQPRPDLRLSASYAHTFLDDVTFKIGNGYFRNDVTNGSSQTFSLGMSYLIK